MIPEIEYYKGDTLLLGKAENAAELQEQLSQTANGCDTLFQ